MGFEFPNIACSHGEHFEVFWPKKLSKLSDNMGLPSVSSWLLLTNHCLVVQSVELEMSRCRVRSRGRTEFRQIFNLIFIPSNNYCCFEKSVHTWYFIRNYLPCRLDGTKDGKRPIAYWWPQPGSIPKPHQPSSASTYQWGQRSLDLPNHLGQTGILYNKN